MYSLFQPITGGAVMTKRWEGMEEHIHSSVYFALFNEVFYGVERKPLSIGFPVAFSVREKFSFFNLRTLSL
jgi:hypothetical protein